MFGMTKFHIARFIAALAVGILLIGVGGWIGACNAPDGHHKRYGSLHHPPTLPRQLLRSNLQPAAPYLAQLSSHWILAILAAVYFLFRGVIPVAH